MEATGLRIFTWETKMPEEARHSWAAADTASTKAEQSRLVASTVAQINFRQFTALSDLSVAHFFFVCLVFFVVLFQESL